MVITKTPFRMSFFGGGTDVESFFNKYRGAILSTTIDKYCYVTAKHQPQFFEWKSHFTYSQIEYVNSYEEIQHPLIRNTMKFLNLHELRITYEADLPAKSGLGTSSSFAVGLLNALYCLKGVYKDKNKLAQEAIYVERVLCNEAGGWQDQIAAAYGGFNRIDFSQEGFKVKPVIISNERKKRLNDSLMLFFTGLTRISSNVQKSVSYDNMDAQRVAILKKMYEIVDEAESILTDSCQDIDTIGELLNETWQLKKKNGKSISTNYIDDIYNRGIKAGAVGGKILGAGGGGFMLFYVPKPFQERVKEELKELLYIPFVFETDGTQVIYYKSEE